MQHINVLSEARCGSTYVYWILVHYIMGSKNLSDVGNEPFNGPFDKNLNPTQMNQKLKRFENTDSIIVIKNHSHQIDRLQNNYLDLYDRFKKLNLYTIVLIRRNIFNIVLSNCIAQVTDEWVHYSQPNEKIFIDPKRFKSQIVHFTHNLNNIVQNRHRMTYDDIIFYEDLTSDPKTDFLSLKISETIHDDFIVPVQLTQVSRAPEKQNIVENYEQLQDLTNDTLHEINPKFISHLQIKDHTIIDCDWQTL